MSRRDEFNAGRYFIQDLQSISDEKAISLTISDQVKYGMMFRDYVVQSGIPSDEDRKRFCNQCLKAHVTHAN